MRILIVEDDVQLAQTLKRALEQSSYQTECVHSAEHADLAVCNEDFDMLILDWMLPQMSGLQLLRNLRQRHLTCPVLMLTANVATEAKVEGLDAGADDYLAKPFELDELLARIRVLSRRPALRPEATVAFNNLLLDLNQNALHIADETHTLSLQEARLLKLLMDYQGAYVSKARIESYLSSWDEPVTLNAIEALVSRLRKKIGGDHIKTLRTVGYKVD